ncbi:uncharacterized protein HMPREF1541_08593 [Cyphellophora europaea CBS 101466]|uniref:Enoyl reductase (ER) domain-containing protein n=1 Tax=Cyphellophora europaea (strain CBS 101466) TaxID=1220924 RepID=W2RIL8_CYPE1|nr:uncharacterized protein HMPREF1541_08593 [Cyphellophora europaea CBS 101466]ETN36316.1 hypothetical protein HMPREF1541_08593 [Cyphellophora europaea CBS 101466]
MSLSVPSTMKAARRVGNGYLADSLQVDTDVPWPKNANALPPKHVLVKVAYTSLNPVDAKIPDAPLVGRLAFKGIPCFDYAGTVVRSSDAKFKEGQRVFGQTEIPNFGACAEYLVVSSKSCFLLPDEVKLEDAATIGIAGLTAYQCLVPFVGKGDTVLINGGSGGTGTFGIQIAKVIGCSVTAICSGANAELCKSMGADEVIDYRSQDVVDVLKQGGQRYDLMVDNVFADAKLYWSCHEYLKPSGRYLTIAGGPDFQFITRYMSVSLWPSFLGGGQRSFKFLAAATQSQDYEQLANWVADGVLKPVIEQVYAIEDVREAFKRLGTGRVRGKLVIKIS